MDNIRSLGEYKPSEHELCDNCLSNKSNSQSSNSGTDQYIESKVLIGPLALGSRLFRNEEPPVGLTADISHASRWGCALSVNILSLMLLPESVKKPVIEAIENVDKSFCPYEENIVKALLVLPYIQTGREEESSQ